MADEILNDFSGGQAQYYHPADFRDNEWAELRGLMFTSPRHLRTQFEIQLMEELPEGQGVSFGLIREVENSRDYLVRKHDAETGDEHFYIAQINPSGTGGGPATFGSTSDVPLTWEEVTDTDDGDDTYSVDIEARFLCKMRMNTATSTGVFEAALYNWIPLVPVAADTSYLVWVDDLTGTVKDDLDPFPDGTEESPATGMPFANRGVMWGDSLVLGDVMWKDDPSAAFDINNAVRQPNTLWISEPGDVTKWDILNVIHMGSSNDVIQGLVPLERGLLVLTAGPGEGGGGVYLLEGDAGEFAVRTLRSEMDIQQNSAALWPYTGTAVWLTLDDKVMQCDGEEVHSLTQNYPFGLDHETAITDHGISPYNEHLLVWLNEDLWCFTAFDETGEGAWTRLEYGDTIDDFLPRYTENFGSDVYVAVLTSGTRRIARMIDVEDAHRGKVIGVAQPVSIATRTLGSRQGFRRTMWEVVGVRATSGYRGGHIDITPGQIDDIVLKAGPHYDSDPPTLTRTLNEPLHQDGDVTVPERRSVAVRGPGLCQELSVEVNFSGDVSPEAVSVTHRPGAAWGDREGR